MEIKPSLRTAIVESLTQVTPKVYVARLGVTRPPWQFTAGQYGSFIIDTKTRRNFSFASPPNGTTIEICADITPMGPGSLWLMNLKKGDEVQFLGPLGHFTVDMETTDTPVFIATGTGIAPIRAMTRDFLTKNSSRNVVLYFGLRYEEDIFWDSEFKALSSKHPSFSYTVTLSQPGSSWKGEKGRVTDYIFANDHYQNCDFYVCGGRDMIRNITDRLLASNIDEVNIKTELFY